MTRGLLGAGNRLPISTFVTTITGGTLGAGRASQSFRKFNDWTFNELGKSNRVSAD